MKWIKRNWWIVTTTIFSIYMLFSTKINVDLEKIKYHELMTEVFTDLFKYKIENINFVQILLVLGINYCSFYYLISITLDFSKGVKDLVRYTSKNLFAFDLKMLKLVIVHYISKFLYFISITLFLYVFMFRKFINYQDLLFIILWGVSDILIFYIVQRFNSIESVTVFLVSIYFLSRKYIFDWWWMVVMIVILHWIYDKYRREK